MRDNVRKADEFEIWPENQRPIELFIALQTQWRMGPAGPCGLDYGGVEAAFRLMGIECDLDLFAQVRLMERAALDCFAEARNGN